MTGWLLAHSHSGADLTIGGHSRTQLQQLLHTLRSDTMVASMQKLCRWSRAPAPEGSSCLLRFASQQIVSIHLSALLPAFTAPKSRCNTPDVPHGAHLLYASYACFHIWPSQRCKQTGFLMRSWAEQMHWKFAQLTLHTWSWAEAQAPLTALGREPAPHGTGVQPQLPGKPGSSRALRRLAKLPPHRLCRASWSHPGQ